MALDILGETTGDGNSESSPFDLCFANAFYKGKCNIKSNDISAIYFFYSIWTDSKNTRHTRLLYIGKALDLKRRVSQHEVVPKDFPLVGSVDVKELDDYLCDPDDVNRECFYAYANVDGRKLERFEAAAIEVFQPIINIRNKKGLGCHVESWFKCSGTYAYEGSAVQHAAPDD